VGDHGSYSDWPKHGGLPLTAVVHVGGSVSDQRPFSRDIQPELGATAAAGVLSGCPGMPPVPGRDGCAGLDLRSPRGQEDPGPPWAAHDAPAGGRGAGHVGARSRPVDPADGGLRNRGAGSGGDGDGGGGPEVRADVWPASGCGTFSALMQSTGARIKPGGHSKQALATSLSRWWGIYVRRDPRRSGGGALRRR
jgi:hypothetical protein